LGTGRPRARIGGWRRPFNPDRRFRGKLRTRTPAAGADGRADVTCFLTIRNGDDPRSDHDGRAVVRWASSGPASAGTADRATPGGWGAWRRVIDASLDLRGRWWPGWIVRPATRVPGYGRGDDPLSWPAAGSALRLTSVACGFVRSAAAPGPRPDVVDRASDGWGSGCWTGGGAVVGRVGERSADGGRGVACRMVAGQWSNGWCAGSGRPDGGRAGSGLRMLDGWGSGLPDVGVGERSAGWWAGGEWPTGWWAGGEWPAGR
jgi:hypothetical protein